MRIGVITTSYPRSDDDPAGNFVAGFARWLSQRAEVEVVCAAERGPLFYGGGAPGALSRGGAATWMHAAAFSGRLLARAAARARHWDAIVSHWLIPCGAIGLALSGNRPHLAIAHGSDTRLLARMPGGHALARTLSRHADLVYVARALELEGAPGRVVPMGIDCATLASGDRARTRAALGLDGFTVLYLGRLSEEKGPDLLIRALPDGVTLLIAGTGPLAPSLANNIATTAAFAGRHHTARVAAEPTHASSRSHSAGAPHAAASPAPTQSAGGAHSRVRLLGEVRGRAKIDLLAACDAVVVPSRSDGAPVVILEAMAAGLPIVATRVGGISELIVEGVDGLLCEPDGSSLAVELERLRDSPSLCEELARAGRVAARAHDWSVAGPQLAHRLIHRIAGKTVDTFSTSDGRIVVARC